MNNGITYFNFGNKCISRLLVSIYSLRKYYSGDVTILSWGDESHILCEPISKNFGVKLIKINPTVAKCEKPHFLVKTLFYKYSPYINTLCIDSDTRIVGKIDELFDHINSNMFLVTALHGYRTTNKIMGSRMRNWSPKYDNLIKQAYQYKQAINCGIHGFNKQSTLLDEWYDVAVHGKDAITADETACQLLITKHKHKLMGSQFNYPYKYKPNVDDIRIIHYWGGKHKYDSVWADTYNKIKTLLNDNS